ncbi:MAG: F0F1 ATP synthase subunit delta [Granulosicoccus sp.]|nr:F0F1 ATP synthase subunit delta [Granulosicoccus sp.]
MADFTTAARPYAKAAFEMARDNQQYDAWSERLSFLAVAVKDEALSSALEAPGLTHQHRAEIIEKIAADKLDDGGKNFVRLLAENNRLAMLPDIAGIYEVLRAEAEGEIEAHVTSAFELQDDQRDRIAAALAKRLDRKIKIVSTVDSDLIGGAIIKAGDLVIDGSLKGRLNKMSQTLSN